MVFDAFVGCPTCGQPKKNIRTGPSHRNPARRTSLAPVSEPGTVGSGIELGTVLSFIDIAVDALAGAREEIDALNVYPVPDGDTGTNMYLTMAAARDAVRERAETGDADRAALFEAFTRGALLGARGNSGVILSEMLRAIMGRIAEAQWDERNGAVMVDALKQATEASYAAVGTPVEGTMLSVCRAASEAAASLLDGEPRVRSRDVLTTSAAAAREALARTPDQLQGPSRRWGCRRRRPRGRGDPRRRRNCTHRETASAGRGRTADPAADRWPNPAPTWWTTGRHTR